MEKKTLAKYIATATVTVAGKVVYTIAEDVLLKDSKALFVPKILANRAK